MLVTLGIGRSELDQTLYQALEQVKNYEYAGEYDFLEDLGLESCIFLFLHRNHEEEYSSSC
ncbi:hypothetical protein L2022_10280, partial [Lactobacillus gasseri]|nr:hypothetical protein [Lactobacillus gasseri]